MALKKIPKIIADARKALNLPLNITTVLLIALVLRLLVFCLSLIANKGDYAQFYSADSYDYIRLARELTFNQRFGWPQAAEIFRTPGYPLFLAIGIFLGNPVIFTLSFQLLLSCLTVYLIFKIGLVLFEKEEIAVLCALLYALEPLSILYVSQLLSETLFTFLIILFLYYFFKYIQEKTLIYLIVSAIVLSACVYVRVVGYFLPLFMGLVLLAWILIKRKGNRLALIHLAIFFFASSLFIGIWQVRNQVKAGYPFFSALGDYNLYYYEAASVLAKNKRIPFYEMQDKLSETETETDSGPRDKEDAFNQALRYQGLRNSGIKVLTQDPFSYLGIYLRGFCLALSEPAAIDYLRLFKLYPESLGLSAAVYDSGLSRTIIGLYRQRPVVFWSCIFLELSLFFYFLLAIAGLGSKNWFIDQRLFIFFCLGVYLFFTLRGGVTGYSRYRHPLMPIICLLAGYGLSKLTRPKKNIANPLIL